MALLIFLFGLKTIPQYYGWMKLLLQLSPQIK